MHSRLIALAVVLSLAVPALGGGRRPQTDRPERTPGPVRFTLEAEVLDPDDTHVFVDGGTFDTQAQAVSEVERVTRDGICVSPEPPPDPGTFATCYPPPRQLRTRILVVWL